MNSKAPSNDNGGLRLGHTLFKNVRNSMVKIAFQTLITGLLLTFVFNINAYSWSNPGHMMVALIAYKNLTSAKKARVNALVALNPKINQWRALIPSGTSEADTKMMLFAIAATWADQIKGDGQHNAPDGTNGGNTPPTDGTAARNIGYSDNVLHKYWHFIDRPFSQDGTTLIQPDIPNAETQIRLFREVLASNQGDNLKSYDLVWLEHLVGDIHQPLHGAARFSQGLPRGDEGGNSVTVSVCDENNICRPETKLHSFWDGLFGNPLDLKVSLGLAMEEAKGIPTAPPAPAADLNVTNWIDESFNLAKTEVYHDPILNGRGPFKIKDNYRCNARSVASKRVALAAARLANILNNELN